jgi:hypothetical protein
VRFCRHGAVNHTVFGDQAREIHFRDCLDDAGSADAGDADAVDLFGKSLFIRPFVDADHLETGLQRVLVDADALDGSGRCPLAGGDFRALKSRTGGGGGGQQAVLVAKHDFGVGADIDEQRVSSSE